MTLSYLVCLVEPLQPYGVLDEE